MHTTISDIQTSSLLYYDQEFADKCYEFCMQRDIDYLPSINEPNCVYCLNESTGGFIEVQIEYGQKVDSQLRIFDPKLLGQFAAQPLLFVYSGGYLSGIIHFSDYNRPAVSSHLYQAFFDYEVALREFLVLNDVGDQDMYEYFAQGTASASDKDGYFKSRLAWFKKNKALIAKGAPFEQYYLSDLVNFICDRNHMSLDKCVVDLRNGVMHAHRHVGQVAQDEGQVRNAVYDRESFAEFFLACLALHRDLKRVRNRITYLRSGMHPRHTNIRTQAGFGF
jgi:hypothetical protein